jgi:hypothetical protein
MPSKSPKRKSRSKPFTVKVKCSRKNKKQCKRSPLSCTRDKRAIPGRKNSKTTLRPRCRSRGKKIIARDAARRIQKMVKKSKRKSKRKSKSKSKSKSNSGRHATKNGKKTKDAIPMEYLKQDGTISKNKKRQYNAWYRTQ